MGLISWSACSWQAFQPSLMFANKARVIPSEAGCRGSTLGYAPSLMHVDNARGLPSEIQTDREADKQLNLVEDTLKVAWAKFSTLS